MEKTSVSKLSAMHAAPATLPVNHMTHMNHITAPKRLKAHFKDLMLRISETLEHSADHQD